MFLTLPENELKMCNERIGFELFVKFIDRVRTQVRNVWNVLQVVDRVRETVGRENRVSSYVERSTAVVNLMIKYAGQVRTFLRLDQLPSL